MKFANSNAGIKVNQSVSSVIRTVTIRVYVAIVAIVK